VTAMNGLQGFDVVIVCCSGEKQADYWQARLTAVRCVRMCVVWTMRWRVSWRGGAGAMMKNGSSRKGALAMAHSRLGTARCLCVCSRGFDPILAMTSSSYHPHATINDPILFRGQVLPADCKVLAVFEDWAGDGAGNGPSAHV
jgi:hypothetical protein